MSVSIVSLRAMSTQQLKTLRADYIKKRQGLAQQHRSSRMANFSTDRLSVNDTLRAINNVLGARRVNKQPLKEFK